eukprot:Nk52_evm21s485 gene=Nk52_evmTU21s485
MIFGKGASVEVSDLENRWYKAVVESIDTENGRYFLSFADGEELGQGNEQVGGCAPQVGKDAGTKEENKETITPNDGVAVVKKEEIEEEKEQVHLKKCWENVKGFIPFKARRVRPARREGASRRRQNVVLHSTPQPVKPHGNRKHALREGSSSVGGGGVGASSNELERRIPPCLEMEEKLKRDAEKRRLKEVEVEKKEMMRVKEVEGRVGDGNGVDETVPGVGEEEEDDDDDKPLVVVRELRRNKRKRAEAEAQQHNRNRETEEQGADGSNSVTSYQGNASPADVVVKTKRGRKPANRSASSPATTPANMTKKEPRTPKRAAAAAAVHAIAIGGSAKKKTMGAENPRRGPQRSVKVEVPCESATDEDEWSESESTKAVASENGKTTEDSKRIRSKRVRLATKAKAVEPVARRERRRNTMADERQQQTRDRKKTHPARRKTTRAYDTHTNEEADSFGPATYSATGVKEGSAELMGPLVVHNCHVLGCDHRESEYDEDVEDGQSESFFSDMCNAYDMKPKDGLFGAKEDLFPNSEVALDVNGQFADTERSLSPKRHPPRVGSASTSPGTDDDGSGGRRKRVRRTSEAQKLQIDHPGKKVCAFSELFECEIDGCKKSFRKENALGDHIKYFHKIGMSQDEGSPSPSKKRTSPMKNAPSNLEGTRVNLNGQIQDDGASATNGDAKNENSARRSRRNQEVSDSAKDKRPSVLGSRKSTRSSTRIISECSTVGDAHLQNGAGLANGVQGGRSQPQSGGEDQLKDAAIAGGDEVAVDEEKESPKKVCLFDTITETIFEGSDNINGELLHGNAVVVQWGSRRYRGRISEPKGVNYVVAFEGGLVCTVMRKDIFPLTLDEVEEENATKQATAAEIASGGGSSLTDEISDGCSFRENCGTMGDRRCGEPKNYVRDYDKKAAEEGTLIGCLCGYDMDVGHMIQCEYCLAWQHSVCVGVDVDNVPEEYVCEDCARLHRDAESSRMFDSLDSRTEPGAITVSAAAKGVSRRNAKSMANALEKIVCQPARDENGEITLCCPHDRCREESEGAEKKKDVDTDMEPTANGTSMNKLTKCTKMLRIYLTLLRDCGKLQNVVRACGLSVQQASRGETGEVGAFQRAVDLEKQMDFVESQAEAVEETCANLRRVLNGELDMEGSEDYHRADATAQITKNEVAPEDEKKDDEKTEKGASEGEDALIVSSEGQRNAWSSVTQPRMTHTTSKSTDYICQLYSALHNANSRRSMISSSPASRV